MLTYEPTASDLASYDEYLSEMHSYEENDLDAMFDAMIDSDDRTDEEKVTDDMVYARQAMIDDYESVA